MVRMDLAVDKSSPSRALIFSLVKKSVATIHSSISTNSIHLLHWLKMSSCLQEMSKYGCQKSIILPSTVISDFPFYIATTGKLVSCLARDDMVHNI